MATIRTAIQITDGMSPVFRSMSNAMNIVLNSFESIQRASHNAIDTSSIQAARQELARAEVNFNQIENEIRQADQAQVNFNNDVRNGTSATGGLMGKIMGMAASLGAVFGVKQVFGLSDQFVSTTARLNIMNDGLHTTVELQDLIFQSAQRSRTAYLDTAAAVSKLGILAGGAFKNTDEMVFFAEQMNKQFKVGGSSIQEQISAMYQLTQAMAAGKLQGDEFRSIMENAPMLAQAIAKYTGKSMGDLKKMSSEGEITAAIIKNAMFEAADKTNKQFSELPMTWGQLWTTMINNVLYYSQPILEFINFLANNWAILKPLILGVAAATLIYLGATYGVMAATLAWTKIQAAFNAVMALNPIVLVVLAVILLIAIFYAAVAAVNKFTGTTYSATGMIVGAIMVAAAIIGNIFIAAGNLIIDVWVMIWNFIMTFAEFFANVFNDPIGSIIRLFAGMADTVLSILGGIASALDTVFGSNMAETVNGWKGSLQAKVDARVDDPQYKALKLDSSAMHYDRLDYAKAYNKGYGMGVNLADKFSMDDLANSGNMTASNTGAIKDKMDATEEDLKYLRDLAEMEVVNRFTTAEIKVDMTNHNQIASNLDLDGVISYFGEALNQTLASVAEGV
jgi:tape measure domain-containing protein